MLSTGQIFSFNMDLTVLKMTDSQSDTIKNYRFFESRQYDFDENQLT